jgi:hypothetical protein
MEAEWNIIDGIYTAWTWRTKIGLLSRVAIGSEANASMSATLKNVF